LLGAIALSLLSDAAVWAHSTPLPPETIKQVGATAIVYKGPQVDVVVSYRFAAQNPTGTWLMLDTLMTAATEAVELPRTSIWVRTPTGKVVPLATQRAFGEAYSELAASIARANVFREPLGYLPPLRVRPLEYFSEPGRHLSFESVWLDEWHNTYGRLYFQLPENIQRGKYELLINLSQSQVRIPFAI
jgi:hypothetical protein